MKKRLKVVWKDPKLLSARERWRLGEILTDATFEAPWNLRWPAGDGDDPPGEETTSAYVRMLAEAPTSDIFLYVEETKEGKEEIVGYILGCIFTDEIIAHTHMGGGIDPLAMSQACPENDHPNPLPGDYYWAVVMIQGSTGCIQKPSGWETRDLPCYRSQTIVGTRAFHHLASMLVAASNRHGCKRHWVRTDVAQPRVIKVAVENGFKPVGFQEIHQGEGSEPSTRVVLVRAADDYDYTTEVFGGWER